MDNQTIFSGMLAIILAGVTWWVNTVWGQQQRDHNRINSLELKLVSEYRTNIESDRTRHEILERLDRIGNLELLLAQQYVTKSELKEALVPLLTKLDSIYAKLDKKQDKV